MADMGLGCVKTPKSNLRIEISSRLRQFEKQNAGDHCREKTTAKTIPRLHRARTFSHSLGLGCVKTLCRRCRGVAILTSGVMGAFFRVDYALIAAMSG
jgi:hypothetical protein